MRLQILNNFIVDGTNIAKEALDGDGNYRFYIVAEMMKEIDLA
jgi:hypothetical protein